MWKAGAGRNAPASNPKAAAPAAADDEWDTDPNFVVEPA